MHHARTAIATFRSAPLSTIAVRLMKISQNLYAETLLMTMSDGAARNRGGGTCRHPGRARAVGRHRRH